MNETVLDTPLRKNWALHINISNIERVFSKIIKYPIQFYGHLFLGIAILLSALSNVYLKTIYREQMNLLQSAQGNYEQLKEKQYYLQVQHEALSSTTRLQAMSPKIGLIAPKIEQIERLLKTL